MTPLLPLLWSALASAQPCDEGVAVARQRPFYADPDGDSFATEGARVVWACVRPEGTTPDLGDCLEGDRAVHPRAKEVCNGIDDDCDGLVDEEDELGFGGAPFPDLDGDGAGSPGDAPTCAPDGPVAPDGWDCNDADDTVAPGDLDGDGFSACDTLRYRDPDDTDPGVHPGALEVCDGVDSDADGHLDRSPPGADPGPLGCDLCPTVEAAAQTALVSRILRPCVIDPEATGCAARHVAWVPRLARPRRALFVYLPSQLNLDWYPVPQLAAQVGYRALQLGVDLQSAALGACPDTACQGAVRAEVHSGEDASPDVEVGRADSVMGRLEAVLNHLDQTFPAEGWGQYLGPDGVRRDLIVLAGGGTGSGAVAHAGVEETWNGVLLLGEPQATPLGPPATPPCAWEAAVHRAEVRRREQELAEAWDALGIAPRRVAEVITYPVDEAGACNPDRAMGRADCWVPNRVDRELLPLVCGADRADQPTCAP